MTTLTWKQAGIAILLTTALLTLASRSAHAQFNRGTISGIVTDPSGAAVPGATIVVTHSDTGITTRSASTASGNYSIPGLQVGTYVFEAESPGFKRFISTNVNVAGGSNIRIDAILELGAVTESVEVTSDATPLQTEEAQVASTVNNKLVDNLPLVVAGQIRNVMNLAEIVPEARTGSNRFRIGGGQGDGWELLMDGSSTTSASSNYQYERAPLSTVSPDAVSEFTVATTGMKAETGRSMGVISFAMKSGTNEFHGNLYEYLRNEALDARGFFAERKAVLKQHNFGGTIGGPIVKDQTFFFFTYEGFRNRSGAAPTFNTIPLAEMWNGDFSQWVTAAGAAIPIYDTYSTVDGADGAAVRDPFPNNQIPQTRFDRVFSNYRDLRPADMVPNRPGARQNYFRQAGGNTEPWDKFSAKVDHAIGQKNRLSFLIHKGIWEDIPSDPNNPAGLPLPFNGTNTWYRQNTSYRFTWNRTIGTRILNTLRASYQDENGDITAITAVDPDAKWGEKLGIINSAPEDRGVPAISMTEYTNLGGSVFGFDRGYNTHLADDLSIVSGKHTFKFGGFFQKDRWDGGGQHTSNGQYGFTQLATAIPGDQSRNTGSGFASFMLGAVSTANLQTDRDVVQKWSHWGGYFQDDWRISPKLMLNIGLRYEYTQPISGGAKINGEPDGFSNFSRTTPNPGAAGALGAMVFSGTGPGQFNGALYDGFKWAFSPRLGLAYNIRSTTVIRASAGRSFAALKTTGGSTHYDGFILNRSWASADQEIRDFPMKLDQGLPPWEQPPFLVPEISNAASVIDYWMPDRAGRPTEFLNWSFDVQQQLPGNSVLEVGYRGTKGNHLNSGILNLNQIDPSYLGSLGPTLLRSNINSQAAQAAGIAKPFAGFNGTVQQSLQEFPHLREIRTSNGGERMGSSTYHAMVVKLDKRYSNGLTFLGSYALSKFFTNAERASVDLASPLNYYNLALEKALSEDDQTHITKFAYSYELPLGAGKARLQSGVGNAILGGWTFSGFLSYGSGFPYAVSPGVCPPIYPGACGNRVTIDSYDNWRAPTKGDSFDPFVDEWWNDSAFQQRPASVLQSELGNATRNNPKARSPWNLNENVTLAKQIPINERFSATFRFEAFNLFNRVRWGSPGNTYTAGTFGSVRSQDNQPRRLQMALKLQF